MVFPAVPCRLAEVEQTNVNKRQVVKCSVFRTPFPRIPQYLRKPRYQIILGILRAKIDVMIQWINQNYEDLRKPVLLILL
jgi:hypothetical protein